MNMRPVKSYAEFVGELKESRKIDEGVIDTLKTAAKKVAEFFKGIGASLYNALIQQQKGQLEGVKIFPTTVDINVMKENGVDIKRPSINEAFSPDDNFGILNEKAISLMHPSRNVANVGMKELMETIEDQLHALKTWQKGDPEVAPIMIWGAPGIGKTAIIEAVAKKTWGPDALDERRMIDFALSMKSPEDFVTPFVSGKDELGNPTAASRSESIPASGLPVYKFGQKDGDEFANMKVEDGEGHATEGGIIFLDELTNASERTQKVCFSLLNERRLGDYKIGSKWLVIAASNRTGDDDDTTMLFSSRLGNRVGQVNYAPQFKDWHEWANKAVKTDGSFVVSKDILSFLTFNNEGDPTRPYGLWYYYDPEAKSGEEPSKIYPSPRSWTNASLEVQKRIDRKGSVTDEERETLIAKFVGKAAAAEFMAFLEMSRKIDVNEIKLIYTNPTKAPILKDLNPGEKNAVISTVVNTKANKPFPKDEQENFMNWLILFTKDTIKNGPFAITALQMMQEIHPELKDDEYWEFDLKAKFFDENPGLTKRK